MHYPPFDKLILCAEECPMSMATWLHCWREIYENNSQPFQRDLDDSIDCHDFKEDLDELEAWDLLKVEYVSPTTIEISIPEERNGFCLDL